MAKILVVHHAISCVRNCGPWIGRGGESLRRASLVFLGRSLLQCRSEGGRSEVKLFGTGSTHSLSPPLETARIASTSTFFCSRRAASIHMIGRNLEMSRMSGTFRSSGGDESNTARAFQVLWCGD